MVIPMDMTLLLFISRFLFSDNTLASVNLFTTPPVTAYPQLSSL